MCAEPFIKKFSLISRLIVKGIVHPKITLKLFQTCTSFFSSVEHKDILKNFSNQTVDSSYRLT